MTNAEMSVKLDNMDKRLRNTETALVALWSLTKDTFPSHALEVADNMMEGYFEAQERLNGFSDDTFFE